MSAQADMLYYETQAQDRGLRFVFGVDEAGRGPLAGPVVAAAVYLREYNFITPINDSKKMTCRARLKAYHEIWDKAYVGIGMMNEKAIDTLNILNASHWAMEMAVLKAIQYMPRDIIQGENFKQKSILLIDGNIFKSTLPYTHQTIVGGDAKSLSIACASIIAKVYRDHLLDIYDKIFPSYGFAKHKGYPTLAHRLALKNYGPSIIHRTSFQGVL